MSQKPKLGQNFLNDPNAARAIVEALGDISTRAVVEIGPGRGAITRMLAARAGRLTVIELDRELAASLREEFAEAATVQVLEQDVLQTDFAALAAQAGQPLNVVGNLPYYITSDILLRLFAAHASIKQAVIMIQREVADRVAAAPGTSDYGLLSATAQLHARVQKLFTLPPGAFSPPPQVYSSVLRLTMAPRTEELGVDTTGFVAFLRACFAQKRKTLANNLRAAGYPPASIAAAASAAGVSPQARAETLPLEAAAAVYRTLQASDET